MCIQNQMMLEVMYYLIASDASESMVVPQQLVPSMMICSYIYIPVDLSSFKIVFSHS